MKDLTHKIERLQAELDLLQGCLEGKFPEAYLTHVAMEDEPLVLFPGDEVMTKYGTELVIEKFDRENNLIVFTIGKSLDDSRISYVIRRKNAPKK